MILNSTDLYEQDTRCKRERLIKRGQLKLARGSGGYGIIKLELKTSELKAGQVRGELLTMLAQLGYKFNIPNAGKRKFKKKLVEHPLPNEEARRNGKRVCCGAR